MSNFSYTQHRARHVRRARSRKGLQMQRAESAYDTDGLSRDINNKPGDKSTSTLSQSIQAKLSIGSPDDAYEKEADRTADTIVNAPESASFGSKLQKQEEEEEAQAKPLLQKQEEKEELQAKSFLQRQEEEEEEVQPKPLLQKQEEEEELQAKSFLQRQEEKEEVQPKPLLQKQEDEKEEAQASLQKKESSASNTVASETSSRLNSRKGLGKSMAKQTQNFMEAQFNKDFSGVRIHNDNEANIISQKLSAQAFTLGKDIYFNSGKYNPETKEGKHLLAHELTHVVQQNHSLKKKLNRQIQRKCKPAPKKVKPRVNFILCPKIKNNSGIPGFGRTHNKQVRVTANNMKFVEQQICGICGPKNKTVSWVIFPAMANIKASIPVSINKSKINRLGANGERYYIDKAHVMRTGFYTLIDARNKMTTPVLISIAMTKRHEKFHVKQIEKLVKKQLNSRHSDIQQFCPYRIKDGKAWKKMMRGGWSGTVIWYSEHGSNSNKEEIAARNHSLK